MQAHVFMIVVLLSLSYTSGFTQTNDRPRARDLGIPFDGITGRFNSITDVSGVEVGYKTLIKGFGHDAARTGVTIILPKGKTDLSYPIAWFSLNGDGEMTGLPYIEDYGKGSGPIGITNTNSVGIVRDAIGQWCVKKFSKESLEDFSFGLPVVAETWDGLLNNTNSFHVTKDHVWDAIESASNGKISEGNVGGGTGMITYWLKGGSGTSSRVFMIDSMKYTLGVFVQSNFGSRRDLMIAGVPVGKHIQDLEPIINDTKRKDGSIIVIIATDAPLLPGTLKQVAKRATHGIARTGSISSNASGELFLALSTSSPKLNSEQNAETWEVIPKWHLDNIFRATVEATEEAIINAMIAAEDLDGRNGNKVFALPHKRLQEIMKQYNR